MSKKKVKEIILEHMPDGYEKEYVLKYIDDLGSSYATLQKAYTELISIHDDLCRKHYEPREVKVKKR